MANIDVMYSSKSNEWATPQDFFDKLNAEFQFNLDPCATDENHKCNKYFTRETDGLSQNWGGVLRILQSSIRQRDRRMGGKVLPRSSKRKYSRGYAHTGKD